MTRRGQPSSAAVPGPRVASTPSRCGRLACGPPPSPDPLALESSPAMPGVGLCGSALITASPRFSLGSPCHPASALPPLSDSASSFPGWLRCKVWTERALAIAAEPAQPGQPGLPEATVRARFRQVFGYCVIFYYVMLYHIILHYTLSIFIGSPEPCDVQPPGAGPGREPGPAEDGADGAPERPPELQAVPAEHEHRARLSPPWSGLGGPSALVAPLSLAAGR